MSNNPEISMPEIPEESIKEIIFLLPVKSLLKFRSVSPSWLSFIDSPYFLKTHSAKSTPKIILHTPHSCFVLDIKPRQRAQASVLELCFPHLNNYIFGSCNGVLLTHHNDNRKSDVLLPFDSRKDVVLQNPCTRSFHKIPFVEKKWPGPKNVICAPEKFVFGLGYDALTDDYKVFRNCQYYGWSGPGGSPFYSDVIVYSVKMKSHKQIEPFPYYIHGPTDESVFVGGALHWVVSTAPGDKSQWIASFDVSTEEYRLLERPGYAKGIDLWHMHVLGGCLTVVCNRAPDQHTEVWVMKEYGHVESWSKILTLMAVDIGVESFSYVEPLFYSECGKQVLILKDCKELLWYDLEKKSVEFVELNSHQELQQFQALVHLESLVKFSCHGPDPRDEKRGAEDNDEKPKMPKKDDFLSKGFKLNL